MPGDRETQHLDRCMPGEKETMPLDRHLPSDREMYFKTNSVRQGIFSVFVATVLSSSDRIPFLLFRAGCAAKFGFRCFFGMKKGGRKLRPPTGILGKDLFARNACAAIRAVGFGAAEGHFGAAAGAFADKFALAERLVFVEGNAVRFAPVPRDVLFFEQNVDLVAHLFFRQTELRGKIADGVEVFLFDGVHEAHVFFLSAVRDPADGAPVKRARKAGNADRPHGGLADPQSHAEQYAPDREQQGQNHRQRKRFFHCCINRLHSSLLSGFPRTGGPVTFSIIKIYIFVNAPQKFVRIFALFLPFYPFSALFLNFPHKNKRHNHPKAERRPSLLQRPKNVALHKAGHEILKSA